MDPSAAEWLRLMVDYPPSERHEGTESEEAPAMTERRIGSGITGQRLREDAAQTWGTGFGL
jgi:hypothetical protein